MMTLFIGTNSNRGSVRAVEMYQRRFVLHRRRKQDSNIWSKQARREEGSFLYHHIIILIIVTLSIESMFGIRYVSVFDMTLQHVMSSVTHRCFCRVWCLCQYT